MISLGDLRKLLRVSEQDKIRGRESDGGSIRERELPSLVDEYDIELLVVLFAREQPRGAADELVILGDIGVVIPLVDEAVRALVSLPL